MRERGVYRVPLADAPEQISRQKAGEESQLPPREEPGKQILGVIIGKIFKRRDRAIEGPDPKITRRKKRVEIPVYQKPDGKIEPQAYQPLMMNGEGKHGDLDGFPNLSLNEEGKLDSAECSRTTMTVRKHGASTGRPVDIRKKEIKRQGNPEELIPIERSSLAMNPDAPKHPEPKPASQAQSSPPFLDQELGL